MCEFNKDSCTPKCSKYPLCSFFEIERQIQELSSQVNLLFKTVNSLSSVVIDTKENLEIYTKDMLELISELKNKESNNE